MDQQGGSPPQVRGKRRNRYFRWCACRITPAGAGKTAKSRRLRLSAKDHPRRCGENRSSIIRHCCIEGSPPQVRGKLYAFSDGFDRRGITPAGAGKTKLRAAYHVVAQDHPRRCGENCFFALAAYGRMGSPPQVRGKPDTCRMFRRVLGITPAGAGKTLKGILIYGNHWDHPRRCGENLTTPRSDRGQSGSPPQVRGKPKLSQQRQYS